jgi:hypothetical protein
MKLFRYFLLVAFQVANAQSVAPKTCADLEWIALPPSSSIDLNNPKSHFGYGTNAKAFEHEVALKKEMLTCPGKPTPGAKVTLSQRLMASETASFKTLGESISKSKLSIENQTKLVYIVSLIDQKRVGLSFTRQRFLRNGCPN